MSDEKPIMDAELTALAALVAAEIAGMQAENDWCKALGHPMAYVDFNTDAVVRLRAELYRRGVLK